MCPNQRAPQKTKIGFWLTPEEIREIDAIARQEGMNRADFLRKMIEEHAKKLRIKEKNR